jgi:dinuclear metal center YbgI/SA1388 family protein
MSTIFDVTSYLRQIIPLHLAAEWDNVGLLLGDDAAPVERVMTCLTVTPESADEAVEAKVNLIVSHHPILFRGTKDLSSGSSEGAMLWQLARAGIAVYSPHTAFDNAPGGINDLLAQTIGLAEVRPLRTGDGQKQCKIVVFVPDKDLAKVSDALFAAGAGRIGQYSECSFRLAGTGTFFGSDATNPTIGEKGRREEVSEWRLEALCPENAVERAIAAMRSAHSYEEPAYDVYALRPERARGGQGRIGLLPKPTTLSELANLVRARLAASAIGVVGDSSKPIQRVALACGAAGEFLGDAAAAKADVFLTGEIRFHDALTAQAQGIALLVPGHYATERLGVQSLAERLAKQFPELAIWASRRERDPFAVL